MTRIYNVDESALSTVQKPRKIFAAKGKKTVGCLTSAERGQHVTAVCCMGTSGHFVPPALIFPSKNWKHELLDGTPVGTLGLVQEKGWMTGEVFLQWLEHFFQHVKASLEDKVLLVLDGHSSHKNLDVLEYAKTNGVIMICLPPHCTHRMQPLDVAFFGPFKIFYDQEITRWLKAHPGGVVTQYQISSILSVAFGPCPVNADIFEDHQFAPSETTDRPKEPANAEEFPSSSTSLTNAAKESSSPSPAADTNASSNEKNCDVAVTLKVPILEISPLPTSDKVTAKRRATQLTSTPNIKMTKQKAEEKKSRVQRQSKRIVKKRLEFSQEEADDSFDDVDDDDDDDGDDEACLYCNDLYSQSEPKETWFQCMKCKI
ncbi:hypothetical protein ANN_01302 [Periplaneta americana]|uniref:DDE-1 domain-containing protein n=1 Tax=Periplaneta americana TaxID=6978 RepID=A0ABQ8TVL8_PERAM|nr:hypothetical protein ANN_01302 [Periplaneta americana]